MRELDSTVVAEKNKIDGTAAWVWLLELYPNPTEAIYLTNNNDFVSFDGKDYTLMPFTIGDNSEDGTGNPSTLTLTVQNVTLEITALLERNRGFQNRTVILRYVVIVSGTVTEAFSQTFRVQKTVANGSVATFTLGNDDLFKQGVPSQKFLRGRCRWQYKGQMCGYSGILPKCDKTLRGADGCEAHNNARRFGGAPGIPIT